MTTIPASQLANVVPGVLAAGGNALLLRGLMLTENTRVPIGTVQSFTSADAVGAFFGDGSNERHLADIYFKGFDNSTRKPASVLFAQYPNVAAGAYLRGGSVAGLTLAQLQALTGTLSIIVDGDTYSAGSVNLSAATSFSNAATIIASDLNASLPNAATFTGTIATTTMTVTAVASGTLIPGQLVAGAGISGSPTIITQLTSTETDGHLGGKGTYQLSVTETVGSPETITTTAALAVTYDSVSGGFVITSGTTGALSTAAFATGTVAAGLKLTSATGAVRSPGAGAAAPGTFMDGIARITQNWVTFMTAFDPDGGSGNTKKLAFTAWVNGTDDRYAYVCGDTDVTPTVSVPATSSLGYLLQQSNSSGTYLQWAATEQSAEDKCAFVCGTIASINTDQTNGRITLAFRAQTGLLADVTDAQIAINLAGNPQSPGDFGNGYNFYGAYGTANDEFVQEQRGAVSGPFSWMDTYVNEIWMTNNFQLSLMILLTSVGSLPFALSGYNLVETALADDIQGALNFGAIRAGVTLSSTQIVEVNQAAGADISGTISTQGWYLQVKDPGAAVRQSRGPLAPMFWYTDGESVQSINLASIVLQ